MITAPPLNPVPVAPGKVRNIGHTFNVPGGLALPAAPVRLPVGGIYAVLLDPATTLYEIYQSTDGGLTYVNIAAGTGPRYADSGSAAISWHGSVLTVAAVDGSNNFELCDFNASTLSWGAPYANSGIPCSQTYQLLRLSSGDYILAYNDSTQMQIIVQHGAGWGAPANPSANVPAGWNPLLQTGMVSDASDNIYLMGPLQNTGTGLYDSLFYQAFDSSLTPGFFIRLPNANLLQWSYSIPIVGADQNSIELGVSLAPGGPAILRGAPLTALGGAGAWTVGPAIDSFTGEIPRIQVLPGGTRAAIYMLQSFPNFPRVGFEQTDGSWQWQGLPTISGSGSLNVNDLAFTGGPNNEMSLIYGVDFAVSAAVAAIFTPAISGPGPIINPITVQALPLPNALLC